MNRATLVVFLALSFAACRKQSPAGNESHDEPLPSWLPQCGPGERVAWNGTAWTCEDASVGPSCETGQIIVWNATDWVCQDPPTDLPSCEPGQTIGSNGSDWICVWGPKRREVVIDSPNTDILLVIDDSYSMEEEQANLRDNTEAFLSEISKSENLYHIGVITTNVLDQDIAGNPLGGVHGGRLRLTPESNLPAACGGIASSPNPGDGAYFLKRPSLDLPPDELERRRCRLVEDLENTVRTIGIQGSGTEAGLITMARAFGDDEAFRPDEKTQGANGEPSEADRILAHNTGFLRPGADLAIIFLTDEEDCSLEPASYLEVWGDNSECYRRVQAGTAPPVKRYVDFLSRLKSTSGGSDGLKRVRAGLIGGGVWVHTDGSSFVPKGCFIDGQSKPSATCGCWSSSPSSEYFCQDYLGAVYGHACTESCADRCDALPAHRYYDFVQGLARQRLALGRSPGIVLDSICQESYYETLLKIARVLVLSNCFELQEPILDVTQMRLEVTYQNASGERVTDAVPRYAPGEAGACHSEAQCPQGAWEAKSSNEICLMGWGIEKGPEYQFALYVLEQEGAP